MSQSCKKISISTILYNRWDISKITLKSISDTIPDEYEIQWYVADNGSTDSTKDESLSFLKSLNGNVRYFKRFETGVKIYSLANMLMNMSDTEFLVRVDNDLQFSKGWFEDCLKVFSNNKSTDLAFISLCHHLKNKNGYVYDLVNIGGVEIDMVSRRNMNVPGNYFMRTSVLRDIGGFYTAYSLTHCDVYHSLIAKQIGYRYGYLYKNSAIHLGESSYSGQKYFESSIKERSLDNDRYVEICRGNLSGKSEQEIEFAKNLVNFKRGHFKSLIEHNINILLADVPDCISRVFDRIISEIPRFRGSILKVHDFYKYSSEGILEICKLHKINYIFCGKYESLLRVHDIKNVLLNKCFTEITQPLSNNIGGHYEYYANVVSNRMSEVVSLVTYSGGKNINVLNHLDFFNSFMKFSLKNLCVGTWRVGYSIVNGQIQFGEYSSLLCNEYLISEKSGQPQILIMIKSLERDFHTFYHWKYLVNYGELIEE